LYAERDAELRAATLELKLREAQAYEEKLNEDADKLRRQNDERKAEMTKKLINARKNEDEMAVAAATMQKQAMARTEALRAKLRAVQGSYHLPS
jgi:hypothetical protein